MLFHGAKMFLPDSEMTGRLNCCLLLGVDIKQTRTSSSVGDSRSTCKAEGATVQSDLRSHTKSAFSRLNAVLNASAQSGELCCMRVMSENSRSKGKSVSVRRGRADRIIVASGLRFCSDKLRRQGMADSIVPGHAIMAQIFGMVSLSLRRTDCSSRNANDVWHTLL